MRIKLGPWEKKERLEYEEDIKRGTVILRWTAIIALLTTLTFFVLKFAFPDTPVGIGEYVCFLITGIICGFGLYLEIKHTKGGLKIAISFIVFWIFAISILFLIFDYFL